MDEESDYDIVVFQQFPCAGPWIVAAAGGNNQPKIAYLESREEAERVALAVRRVIARAVQKAGQPGKDRDEAVDAARRALRLAHHSRLMAKRAGLPVDVEGEQYAEIVSLYPWIVAEEKEEA